jgi:hypothetical protein
MPPLSAPLADLLEGVTGMGGEALKWKLPSLKLDLVKPTRWDLLAVAVVVAGLALTVADVLLAQKSGGGAALAARLTPLFVGVQLVVSLGGLMLLGKTAKEGTIWGNLASVAAMLIGIGGVMLAAALWAAA